MGTRGPGAVPLGGEVRAEPLERLPQPPAALSPSAAEAWRDCGRRAIELRTLTAPDLTGLELLARTLASIANLEQQLERDGLLIRSGDCQKAHPALAALNTARGQARMLLCDFGLLPSGRDRLRSRPERSQHAKPWDWLPDGKSHVRAGKRAGGKR